MASRQVYYTDEPHQIRISGGMVHGEGINGDAPWVMPVSAFTAFIFSGMRAIKEWQASEQESRQRIVPFGDPTRGH